MKIPKTCPYYITSILSSAVSNPWCLKMWTIGWSQMLVRNYQHSPR